MLVKVWRFVFPCMKRHMLIKELKKTEEWAQLTGNERRFVAANWSSDRPAISRRVQLILDRARSKTSNLKPQTSSPKRTTNSNETKTP